MHLLRTSAEMSKHGDSTMAAFVCHKLRIGLLMAFVLVLSGSIASAGKFRSEPIVLMYRIAISGAFTGVDPGTGEMTFHVSGPVTVPLLSPAGLIKDLPRPAVGQYSSDLSMNPFDFLNPPDVVRWSCGNCTLTLADGSEFQTYGDIPMEGRALFLLGPVAESTATHNNPNVTTIRMAGCGGIQGTKGPLAGKVGTLCANGIFSFDATDPSTMTGESHCTITLHTPAVQP
jgi:hypothetical protein